ncbi:MAG: Uma2 family endonuclease [Chroococcidiopsidaceae cyanobacterium CP_BM_RX_35]|nr:Uma2 family endonuclease [Chroococcidiopsidaceae cyanobacterium CP_BM_RX_35]
MTTGTHLTLEEFWTLPEGETANELIDGQAIPKVSPKYFHSSLQGALLFLIRRWCRGFGRVRAEWSIALKRSGRDWVPAPDVTYVSYERLPKSWKRNEACPVPPELAIEIISPGQTLKEFEDKAKDYLAAGVLRVWVIDPEPMTLRVFQLEELVTTDNRACGEPTGNVLFYSASTKIVDSAFPGLEFTLKQVFEEAELIEGCE